MYGIWLYAGAQSVQKRWAPERAWGTQFFELLPQVLEWMQLRLLIPFPFCDRVELAKQLISETIKLLGSLHCII